MQNFMPIIMLCADTWGHGKTIRGIHALWNIHNGWFLTLGNPVLEDLIPNFDFLGLKLAESSAVKIRVITCFIRQENYFY